MSATIGADPTVAVAHPDVLTGARSRRWRAVAIAAAAAIAAIGVTVLFSRGQYPFPAVPTTSPTPALTLAPTSNAAVLAGHTNIVTSVAFGPNGRILASGSADNTVRLWSAADAATPVPIGKPLNAHTGAVLSVALSPNGNALATGSSDKSVKLWDVSDPAAPRLSAILAGAAAINSVAFSSDSRFLAAASDASTITLWDAVTGRAVDVLRGHSGPVRSVSFAPSGYVLASGGADRTARLWDLSRQLNQPPTVAPDSSVEPSDDKKRSGMGRFTKGSTVAGDPVRLIELGDPLTPPVPAPVSPTPAGPTVLTGYNDAVVSVAFSPDGHTLATGSGIAVTMWDVTELTRPTQLGPPITGHNAPVTAVAVSPNGRVLASSSADNTVLLWDVTDPARPTRLGQPLTGASASVTCVAFSANGRTVAGGSADQTLLLWRPFP